MKVAILFSGGKDSCQAVKWAIDNGHKIEVLIAIKPKNNEAYIWHYPTVEWSVLQAQAMGIPLILAKTEDIGPATEAKVLEKIFSRVKVDAVLLGGVGLQKTQINAIKNIANKFRIKVLVPYEILTSEELLDEELRSGFDIRIADVAVDGLTKDWIWRKLDSDSINELKKLSRKFGFDSLGEGGHYNTFVVDGSIFKKKIEVTDSEKIWDSKTSSGYLEIKNAILIPKE